MGRNREEIIKDAEDSILHTYNRFPVVFDHGRGVYLYDTDGREYLDFGAGIAVSALGYGNEEYGAAVKAQVDKLLHISNLYYNEPVAEAAKLLTEAAGMERVFFTNSGKEICVSAGRSCGTRDHCDEPLVSRQKSGSFVRHGQCALQGTV